MILATNEEVVAQAQNDVLAEAGIVEAIDFIKSASVTVEQQALYDQQVQATSNYLLAEMEKQASLDDYIAAQAQNDVLVKYNLENPIAFIEKNASYSDEQKALYSNVYNAVDEEINNAMNKQKQASNAPQLFVDSVTEQIFLDNLIKTANLFEISFKK